MKVEQMRNEIAKVYEGVKWKNKVKEMPDNQVIAVYHSFLKNDVFNLSQKERTPTNIMIMPRNLGRKEAYEQMSLFNMWWKVGGED